MKCTRYEEARKDFFRQCLGVSSSESTSELSAIVNTADESNIRQCIHLIMRDAKICKFLATYVWDAFQVRSALLIQQGL